MELESKHLINTPEYSDQELEDAKKAWLLKYDRDAARFVGSLPDTKRTSSSKEDTQRNEERKSDEDSFNLWELLKVLTPLVATTVLPPAPPALPPAPQRREERELMEEDNFDSVDDEDSLEKKNRLFIENSKKQDKTILNSALVLRNMSQSRKIKREIASVDDIMIAFINRDPTANGRWENYKRTKNLGDVSPFEFKQSLIALDKQVQTPNSSFSIGRNFQVIEGVENSSIINETREFEKENESWMKTMMSKLYSLSKSLYSWRPFESEIEPLKIESDSGINDLSEPLNHQIVTNNVIILGDVEKKEEVVEKGDETTTAVTEITPQEEQPPRENELQLWEPEKEPTDEHPGYEPIDKPTNANEAQQNEVGFQKIYLNQPDKKSLQETYEQHEETPTFKTSTSEFLQQNIPFEESRSKVLTNQTPQTLIEHNNDYGPLDPVRHVQKSNLEILSESSVGAVKETMIKYIMHASNVMYNNTIKEIGRVDEVFNVLRYVYFPLDVISDLLENYRREPILNTKNPDIIAMEMALRQPSLKEKFDNSVVTLPFIMGRMFGNRVIRMTMWKYIMNKLGFDTRSIDEKITYEKAQLTSLSMQRQELESSRPSLPVVSSQEERDTAIKNLRAHPFFDLEKKNYKSNTIATNLDILSKGVNIDDFESANSIFGWKRNIEKTMKEFFPGVEKNQIKKIQKNKQLNPTPLSELFKKATEAKMESETLEESKKRIAQIDTQIEDISQKTGKVEQRLAQMSHTQSSAMNRFFTLMDKGLFYYEMFNVAYQALRELAPLLVYDRNKDISEAMNNLILKNLKAERQTREEIDQFMKNNLSAEGYVKFLEYEENLRLAFEKEVEKLQGNKGEMSVELDALNKVLTPEEILDGKEFSEKDLEEGIKKYAKIYIEMVKSKKPNYENQLYDRLVDGFRQKGEIESTTPDEEEAGEKAIENLAKGNSEVQEILNGLSYDNVKELSEEAFKEKIFNMITLNGRLDENSIKQIAEIISKSSDIPSLISEILNYGSKNNIFGSAMYLALTMTLIIANKINFARKIYTGSGRVGCNLCKGRDSLLVHDKDSSDITCKNCLNSRNSSSKNYNKRSVKFVPIEQSSNENHRKLVENFKKEKMENRLKHVKIPTRHEEFFDGAGIDEKFKYRATRGYLGERNFSPKKDYANLSMLMGENDHGNLNEFGRLNLSSLITKCLLHNRNKIKRPINLSTFNNFHNLKRELEENPKLLEHYTV